MSAEMEPAGWKPELGLAAALLDKVGIPATAFLEYADAVRERKARRVAGVLGEAATLSDLSTVELLNYFAANPDLADLLESSIRAASNTRADDHIASLARVLARAYERRDDANVDDLHEVVRALEKLDGVHIRALLALERVGPRPYDEDLPKPFDIVSDELGDDVLASPVEQRLSALALLNPGVRFDDDRRALVTPFGRRVLAFLSSRPDSH